ncbi:MAG TPA: succinylglutamate desuccinylase/aspartoacylase family protein [Candidatus Baltobacteraceae bacterium]|jgi:hypothetical protein|nr:succinylglutamate desuccinylase/aspartoacylase family protein [Candidatus Baltobacteraceae bacterium]
MINGISKRARDIPPYDDLVAEWKSLRRIRGISLREVACVNAPRTLLLTEFGSAGLPPVSICAGVHGDEPAAPWALLSLVRDGLLASCFAYRIWPCTNPTGYQRGTRENAEGNDVNRSFGRGGTTPESRAIITSNRDRRFALTIDLHEDWESKGFYCYEPPVKDEEGFYIPIVRALDDAGLPVQEDWNGLDLGDPDYHPDEGRLKRGCVLTDPVRTAAHFKDGLPFSVYTLGRSAERTLTFESPSSLPWETRLAIHRTAVVTALESLAMRLRIG